MQIRKKALGCNSNLTTLLRESKLLYKQRSSLSASVNANKPGSSMKNQSPESGKQISQTHVCLYLFKLRLIRHSYLERRIWLFHKWTSRSQLLEHGRAFLVAILLQVLYNRLSSQLFGTHRLLNCSWNGHNHTHPENITRDIFSEQPKQPEDEMAISQESELPKILKPRADILLIFSSSFKS